MKWVLPGFFTMFIGYQHQGMGESKRKAMACLLSAWTETIATESRQDR